jgi:hypothetical protein
MAVWNTYIWVDSADESTARAQELGATVIAEPFDVMDSGRMAVLADPEGAVISLWQAGTHRGAQVVNTGSLTTALQMYAGASSDLEDAYSLKVMSEKQRLQQVVNRIRGGSVRVAQSSPVATERSQSK